MSKYICGAVVDIGVERESQEDYVQYREFGDNLFCVVADGAGSQKGFPQPAVIAVSVLSEYNKRKDWLSDKNSSIKQNTRKYQLQQKLAVNDADQSIIEAKKKTGRKQTENEVREEERKKGIVNFKN